ncbi:MAG TPA: DUF2505 family protein [Polyangiaceae bacterium]|jgi:hypothetical protein
MKFAVDHDFQGISPADYEALYFDEPFAIALCEKVKLGRTLLRLDRTEGRLVRHVRCEPVRDIPGPIAKLLGDKRFSYVEELEFELGKLHGRWRVVPNIATDKVDAKGTLEFRAIPGGVKRLVAGEIKVSVFGIGGLVEKFVVAEVEKSYADAAVFTRDYLAKKSA